MVLLRLNWRKPVLLTIYAKQYNSVSFVALWQIRLFEIDSGNLYKNCVKE